ncbi:sensor histidine kinase [Clostridium sp. UBA3061]|uniref:sensor histidine kinase n=1 Tax=Clostridium sp. UBA3061 TaxID=1946353 RepID=UPI0032170EFC
MENEYLNIINAIVFACSINVTLMLGILLVDNIGSNHIKKLNYIVLSIGFCFYLFFDNSNYVILIYILFFLVSKITLNITYSHTLLGVLLSIICKYVIEIIINQIFLCFSIYISNLYVNLVIIIFYLLINLILYYKKISLFPKDWLLYSNIEKKKTKKDYVNIFKKFFVLTIMMLWIFYIKSIMPTLSLAQQNYVTLFLIAFCIIFIVFIRISAFYDMKIVEALIDKEYQKELLALTDIIRSQRHDFNFHLQAVSRLLKNEKYQECSKYIDVMVKEVQSFNEILSLQDPAIGALLNAFREIAARKGIQLQIVIYYNLEKLRCTVYETNKILGNLIQNAIDEVEQHLDDSTWIEVMILKRSGNSVFRVSNKINENNKALKDIFNSGYSTKKSHEGIGLSTIKKILEKYNGIIYTEIEDDIIHFIVQIPNGL